MYLVKVISSENELVVNVCDAELLNKEFKEGKITLKISEEFYKGEYMSEENVIEVISRATIATFAGKKSVDLAIKCRLIHPESIIYVNGIPHAMFYRLI